MHEQLFEGLDGLRNRLAEYKEITEGIVIVPRLINAWPVTLRTISLWSKIQRNTH